MREGSGGGAPIGYHHFIAQCPVVPAGLELIGARLTFQWDIMTSSAPTHLWISDIGRGRFPCHTPKVIISSRTVWLSHFRLMVVGLGVEGGGRNSRASENAARP